MVADIVIPDEELPNWMKQARRGVDWGVLIIIGFSVLIAWQFIATSALPMTNQNLAYAFRTAETAHAVREGVLYPRWSPTANDGYGAPVYNYIPPFPTAISTTLDVLFTNDTVLALRVTYILGFVIAGLMMYVFVMQRANASAGLAAAILYITNPYIGLTVPFINGDLTEVIAIALLPTVLWAVNRLLTRNQALDALIVAIAYGLLVLTSPLHAMVALVFIAILTLLEFQRLQATLLSLVLAIVLSFIMTGFYWLPAIAEFNAVTWSQAPIEQDTVQSDDWLRAATYVQPDAMFPEPQYALGWAILIALGFSGIVALFGGVTVRYEFLFFVLGIVFALLLYRRLPEQTWLSSIIVLCFAISGSAAFRWLHHQSTRLRLEGWLLAILCLMWASMPIIVGHPVMNPITDVSTDAQLKWEDENVGANIVPYGNAIPSLPIDNPVSPQAAYDERIPSSANMQIDEQFIGTHELRYQVITTQAVSINMRLAYFDGWRATLNDEQIPVTASEDGLVQIQLPANASGILTLRFESTLIRLIGWLVSFVGVVGLIVLSVWRWRNRQTDYDKGQLLHKFDARILLFFVGLLLIGRVVGDNFITRLRPPAQQDSVATVVRLNTSGNLRLNSYAVPQTTVKAGDDVIIATTWEASQPIDADYRLQLSITNAEGRLIQSSEPTSPARLPTQQWGTVGSVTHTANFPLDADIAEGQYNIMLQVWRCSPMCDTPVQFLSAGQRLIGETILLEQLVIQD